MENTIYAAMTEATRLVREGRLNDATQLIQRSLRLDPTIPATSTVVVDEPKRVEETFRLTAPPTTAPVVQPKVPQPDARASAAAEDARPTVTKQPGEGAIPRRWFPLRRPGRLPLPEISGLSALSGLAGLSGLPEMPTMPLPGVPGGRLRGRSNPQAAPAEGQWIAKTHSNAVGTYAYKLYIPSKYCGEPMPLVVMLHGCTQDPDDFAAGTRMNFLAEEAGFLVAYPAQTNCANAQKCWNWFQAAHQQPGKGEPACIAGITQEIMAEYHSAASRIYVAGMSAGGAMAAIMAVAYPSLYAAVGVHSGLAAGSAHDLPSALAAMRQGGHIRQSDVGLTVPLILFHGDHDTTVHPKNADQLVQQWVAAELAASRRTTSAVTVLQGQASGGRSYTCERHHDTEGNLVVERWLIHGAGHNWSGGSPSGSYTDPTGPDASRAMMRFFQEHPRETTGPSPAE